MAPTHAEPVPVAVAAATVLFALVLGLWTVAVPQGRAPDEMAHLDLVLVLAEDATYPDPDERFVGRAVSLTHDGYPVDLSRPWPRYAAADAPPRTARSDLIDRGGTAPDPGAGDPSGPPPAPFVYNQMTQHPPLYYAAMAAVLRVERALLPGSRPPPMDRELGLLRLVNVLLLVPLPVLAWLTVRRMGGAPRAGVIASLLPLGLPQLTHVGGSVNNDNLLVLLAAVLAALLAGVARGRRTGRTDMAVGLVLGLALWAKAFAFALVPWAIAAYVAAWWATPAADPIRAAIARALARAGAVAAAVGSWWWLANLVRHGEPTPSNEDLVRTADLRGAGYDPGPIAYGWTFSGRLLSRTWAWIGFGDPKVALPTPLVVVLVAATLVGLVAVGWAASRGRAVADGPRRVDVGLAVVPLVGVVGLVALRGWQLHVRTGGHAFIQGRYLFAAVVPVMAVIAIGADRALGRRAPGIALAVVVALQGWALVRVVTAFWAGEGLLGPVGSLLAWSPWPSPLVIGVALAGLAALALAVRVVGWRRPGPG